jgi:hypothetical protein
MKHHGFRSATNRGDGTLSSRSYELVQTDYRRSDSDGEVVKKASGLLLFVPPCSGSLVEGSHRI